MQSLRKYEKIVSSDPAHYETRKLSHNCDLNYTGSSHGMERAAATKIFSSSGEKHGLYYTSFYWDGDSKAYPAVKVIYGRLDKNHNNFKFCAVKKIIYGPSKPIKKFEYVGHYLERVGSRLRNLKKRKHKRIGGRKKTH